MLPMKSTTTAFASRLPRRLLWGSVIFWYFWCMTLPLVGRAGSQTPQALQNRLTVIGILSLSILFALLAGWEMTQMKKAPPRQVRLWGIWTFFLIILMAFLLLGAFGA